MSMSLEEADKIITKFMSNIIGDGLKEALNTILEFERDVGKYTELVMDKAKQELLAEGWSLPDDVHYPKLLEVLEALEKHYEVWCFVRIFSDGSGSFWKSSDESAGTKIYTNSRYVSFSDMEAYLELVNSILSGAIWENNNGR